MNIAQDKLICKFEGILPFPLFPFKILVNSSASSSINQSIQRIHCFIRTWRLCEKYSINFTVTLHRCTLATKGFLGFFS